MSTIIPGRAVRYSRKQPTLTGWRQAPQFLYHTYASIFHTLLRRREGHKRLLIALNGVQFFVTGLSLGEAHSACVCVVRRTLVQCSRTSTSHSRHFTGPPAICPSMVVLGM
jgi:hypothetical protein